MNRTPILIGSACVLLVVLVAIYGWSWFFRERVLSADELAEIALTAGSLEEQEAAAAKLAAMGRPAQSQLARVLGASKEPGVRATVVGELASQQAYECMPALLDALGDESLVVRGRAAGAMNRLLQIDVGYRADDPPAQRQAAAKAYRAYWEKIRDKPLIKDFIKKLNEGEA
jgi:hypothetical protein